MSRNGFAHKARQDRLESQTGLGQGALQDRLAQRALQDREWSNIGYHKQALTGPRSEPQRTRAKGPNYQWTARVITSKRAMAKLLDASVT